MSSATPNDWTGQKVLVTGATGFVGSNLVPLLKQTGCKLVTPSHSECDLNEQAQVRRLLQEHKPDLVFHPAAKVGGVLANKEHPAEFSYENLVMGALVLHESWRAGVRKYITLIGACSYPDQAPNPIRETELFNGPPHA